MSQIMVKIRETKCQQELDSAANIFAEAFFNDPLFQMVFKEKSRLKKTKYFFSFLLTERNLLRSDVLLVLHNEEIAGACSFSRPNKAELIPFNLYFFFSTIQLIIKLGFRSFYILNRYFKTISETKSSDSYYINFIGVSKKYRGKGLAKSLMDYVHKIVKEDLQYSQVGLDTENPSNLHYYERYGYHLVSEKKLQNLTIYFMQNCF